MGDGQPDAKKRKISDLRASIPFCSQSALAAICKEIDKGVAYLKNIPDIQFGRKPTTSWKTQACPCMGLFFKQQKAPQWTIQRNRSFTSTFCLCWLVLSAKEVRSLTFCSTCMRRCHHLSPNLGDVWHTLIRCTQGTC